MTATDVKVTLKVHGADPEWTADIVFTNQGKAPAPLYLPNVFPDGTIQNDVFVITADGRPAPYTGAYVKRAAPQKEDFVLVPPGGEARYSARLDKAYAIPSAPGKRRAVYEAFHGDVGLWGGIWKLTSNAVVF